jgi:hypothetical protein
MALSALQWAMVAATTVSTVVSVTENQKSRREQEKARSEQNAQNRAQQMEEQRKQVREERVRRARIMQASENTGTAGSSGEMGAVGGMGTQLASNIGSNLGAAQRGSNISMFQQNAADAANNAQMATSLGRMSNSIFEKFGGAPTPTDTDPLGTFIKQRGF